MAHFCLCQMDLPGTRSARFGSYLGARQTPKVFVLSNGMVHGAQTITLVVPESQWRSNYYFCRTATVLLPGGGPHPPPTSACEFKGHSCRRHCKTRGKTKCPTSVRWPVQGEGYRESLISNKDSSRHADGSADLVSFALDAFIKVCVAWCLHL